MLTIQLLGQFQLLVGDVPIAVPSARLQSLLAYLLLHGRRPLARDQIAYQFWPRSTESQARANLRKILHQLRKTVPDVSRYLAIEPGTLRWRAGAPYTSDVAHFEEALAQVETAKKAGDSAEQRTSLERAVELYGGDLLPTCYEDWLRLKREQLRQAYGDVLHDLVQLLEAQNEYREAIHYARQLCYLDPLRESSYRQLMRLYSLSGDRASAVKTFRKCEGLLREELDVAPSPATRDLYAQILAADGHVRPKHNLPRQLTSFVGREGELAFISRRLQDENCRLLTLVGPGGIGKTRLALQVASRMVGEFADGVFFVSLESASAPNSLVTAVAEALNFSFYRPADLGQQLIDYLRQKQVLLVLDNFEQLLEAAGLLAGVLEQARAVKILVTSRERLKLPQEWLLEIEGLSWPKDPHDERLEDFAAVQLFVQRARKVRPQLTWTAQEKQALVRICQILDGMPLGIELAAAWLRVLSCSEIERELARNLDVLADTRPDLPPRHRSLRAVFEQSWNFLSEAEQRLWCKLAIFHGRFDRRAAKQVAGAAPSSLMAFADKSLLRLDGAGLFSVHGLIRQYGLERLAARPKEWGAIREVHGEYYLRFLHERHWPLLGKEQRSVLAEISNAIDDIRAAWEWAMVGNQFEIMMGSADALARFYHVRGWFEEGREQFSRASAQVRQRLPTPEEEPEIARLLARLLVHEGLFRLRLSDFEEAAGCLEESRTMSTRVDGRKELVMATIRLAEIRFREGEYAQARQLGHEGLAISQPLGEVDDTARALSILGQVAFAQGHYQEAYGYFEQSRGLTEKLGDSWSLAHIHNNLGMITHELGRYETAWGHFQDGLDIFREMDDRWGQALVTNNMGQAALLRQRYDEAGEWLQESLALRREFGNRWAIAFVLNNLGRLKLGQGSYDEAHAYVEESLAIRRHFDDRQGMALCLLNLGDIALAMGESQTAGQRYLECLQTAVEIQNDSLIVSALLGLAKVLARPENGEAASALELLTLVAQHPASTGEEREEAEGLVAELVARFPPAKAEEVQGRGRSLSLPAVAADLLARLN